MNLCPLAGELGADNVLRDGIDEDQAIDEQANARYIVAGQ